jgi:hypothetical protein
MACVGLESTVSVAQEWRRTASRRFPGTTILQFEDQVVSEHAVRLVNASPEARAVCGFLYRPPTLDINVGWAAVNVFVRCAVCADIVDDRHPVDGETPPPW